MLFTPPGGIQCDAQTRASLTPSFVSFTQQEIHMNRNHIIRCVAALIGGVAWGAACGAALQWVCVSASLGTFLTFLAWLITLAIAIASGAYIGNCVESVLTDERLDRGIATVRGWFSAAKKAVA